MKNELTTHTEKGHSANLLLVAVTPLHNLSTDGTALDGVSALRGSGIGATSEDVRINVFSKGKLIGQDYKSTSGNWMHKWICPNGQFERGSWRGRCQGEQYTYQTITE